ncbi:hypothetical protein RIF29_25182 [Crotalaria pallida]|uniref:Reverse transcriptase zinc-binding domain-containing protein n=1 Tax=Crotalaria pallida TaxID=3830 RepID=A0AAN9ELW6_CROPI
MRADTIVWAGDKTGCFSIKSANNVLVREKDIVVVPIQWELLWKWPGPERYKFHIWKLEHDRLLTNERKSTWGLRQSDCPFCIGVAETSLHAMRDCAKATQLWNQIIAPSDYNKFYSMDLFSWIRSNLNRMLSILLANDHHGVALPRLSTLSM